MERWRDWQLSGGTRDELPGRDVFGVDVARGGSDECAIAIRRGDLVERIVTYRSDDTMGTVDQLLKLAVGTVGGVAMVDSIGIGAGVLDRLRQMHREGTSPLDAQPFTASAQSGLSDITGSYSFRNDRSAAWWRMREMLDPSRGSNVMLPDDNRLLAELSTPRWTIANGSVIIVENKDELRKRLGRSTDRADAVISAFFTSGAVPVSCRTCPSRTRCRCSVTTPPPPWTPGTRTSTSPAPSGRTATLTSLTCRTTGISTGGSDKRAAADRRHRLGNAPCRWC
jgi:hypothetical protein